MIIFDFGQLANVDAALVQDAVTIDFLAFFVTLVADDIGNAGQADEDASVVFIAQAALYAVLGEPFAGNLCVVL